ncbi:MAG: hypothetical protein H0W66_02455 [Chthoniobacterales bacterium]|nr:hypothetical protein [Chthoniobacterales bacterium]
MMGQFKFTGDTPALYYAQAAWEFKLGRTAQGQDWVASARKIYSPALNIVFADSFYDLAWLEKPDPEKSSPPSALVQADTPAAIANSTPAMRFGPDETVQARLRRRSRQDPLQLRVRWRLTACSLPKRRGSGRVRLLPRWSIAFPPRAASSSSPFCWQASCFSFGSLCNSFAVTFPTSHCTIPPSL